MTTRAAVPQQKSNQTDQAALLAALADVRAALHQHIARAGGELPADSDAAPVPVDAAPELPRTLHHICTSFGLSAFERSLLLLCAGVELDPELAALCARAQGDPQRMQPSFSLALAALPAAHWSAITPAGPLRRWQLIEVQPGPLLTQTPLRIDERIVHYLLGITYLDRGLASLLTPIQHASQGTLVDSHRALVKRVVAAWSGEPRRWPLPVIQLHGNDPAARRTVAAAACHMLGLQLWALPAELVPGDNPAEAERLLRLWEREAVLSGAALFIECDNLGHGEHTRTAAVLRLVERLGGALFLATPERWHIPRRTLITLPVERPVLAEQQAIWRGVLGNAADQLNGQIDQLASQFHLNTERIQAAGSTALSRVQHEQETDLGQALWDACREQTSPQLAALAQPISSRATWDDLVLPTLQTDMLHSLAAHVRQRYTVYHSWGFAAQGTRGLGMCVLFAGASGTGKTLAAEVLAHALQLDLYRVDLSSVVSKYIGETEKNMRQIFDAAEGGGAILLFDEADALFGKRSEVKDSHDRHANIEVSYLLQRMEAYSGLAILTTNLKSAIDTAFLRRFRFVVQFPFPDAEQRATIWRRVFPAATPTAGLDYARLAQLTIAGGNIRNIALNAAFLAADAGTPVQMHHILRAVRSEYSKLEKTLTGAELAGWPTD